ncbi:MAG: hypothetical protein BWX80_00006 [Candidatus Hydrogenedentes bacterium ADurb.Bin101]|jgi:hypothetical protein|nr:MAG: hypothetical protein BWX80_00006 [Candidatus Hydrogenedentes bacterium ADurb.Bin101]HOC67778.1 hypothetical protein [Candidatus Hydrogenedentota bacterium]
MSKKSKITITRAEDFSEIETELSDAMEHLDETNLRIETMLREHALTAAEESDKPSTALDEKNTTEDKSAMDQHAG